MLFEAFGGSVDEHDLSAAFIDADELSISHSNGSLSKGSFFGPNFLPAFQILAQPAHSIGVTKDVSTHLNGAAMMILHQAIGVEFLDLHLFVNLDGLAPGTVSGCHVDSISKHNGCWDHGCSTGKICFPEHRTIFSVNTEDGLFRALHILPLSLDARRHHGGIMGIVSDVAALPDQGACFLVEGDDSAFFTSRCGQHFISIDHDGFGVAPVGGFTTKLTHALVP